MNEISNPNETIDFAGWAAAVRRNRRLVASATVLAVLAMGAWVYAHRDDSAYTAFIDVGETVTFDGQIGKSVSTKSIVTKINTMYGDEARSTLGPEVLDAVSVPRASALENKSPAGDNEDLGVVRIVSSCSVDSRDICSAWIKKIIALMEADLDLHWRQRREQLNEIVRAQEFSINALKAAQKEQILALQSMRWPAAGGGRPRSGSGDGYLLPADAGLSRLVTDTYMEIPQRILSAETLIRRINAGIENRKAQELRFESLVSRRKGVGFLVMAAIFGFIGGCALAIVFGSCAPMNPNGRI